MEIPEVLIKKVKDYLGGEGIRYFSHLKGLTGTVSPVLKLNYKRKGLPVHPVHLREGMSIRNFLRGQEECGNWDGHDFDDNWCRVVEMAIK